MDGPAQYRPLRIAFFVEGMAASGVDTSTQLLASALRALGHRVLLFVPWKERSAGAAREQVVALAAVRVSSRQPVYWSVPFSWSVYERFRHERFDLVHVHTSTTVNLLAWQMAALMQLPRVYTYHTMSVEYAHYLHLDTLEGKLGNTLGGRLNHLVEGSIELYDRIVCNQADTIVAPSRKAARYLAQIGVKPPVQVVPNGINLHAFRPQRSTWIQNRLGIGPERPVLLFVGRLNQEKRPLLAYDLFRRIHAARPDAVLAYVGDGALRAALEARSAADGLGDSVRLLGLVPYAEMPQVFNSAALWISTSMSEVHPMVALEASACGLPALAWDDPALDGVLLPDQTGCVVSQGDAFVQAALDLLDNPQQRAAMGQAAAAHAASFRVEETALRMAALYRTLLPGTGRNLPHKQWASSSTERPAR